MELVKNIFFNTDKLTANSTIKISYTGELFQNDSENVVIHYGFRKYVGEFDRELYEKNRFGLSNRNRIIR